MTNNDILRRIRYTFDFNDDKVIALFGSGGGEVSREQISNWLRKDDHASFAELVDRDLATFLNGLINDLRGKRDGPQAEPEEQLSRNSVFVKLKIALNLKAEDVLDILKLVDFNISNHELSAFFRKPGHKHYRVCKDQILRNFLHGMQIKYRDQPEEPEEQEKDAADGAAEKA